jgi:hypothetical protein
MGVTLRAQQKPYTVEQLQALDKSQSWEELVGHLQDIPPAKRGPAWNKLVGDGCFAFPNAEEPIAEYCAGLLRSVVLSEPANTDFVWKTAQWIRRNRVSWGAIQYFAKAGIKPGEERCKDGDLHEALISALGMPAARNGELVSQAQKLAFDVCWPATKVPLMHEYKENFDSTAAYFLVNSCKGLKSKDALSPEQVKKCDGLPAE